MNTILFAEDARFMNTVHPDIEQRLSLSSMLASTVIGLAGAAILSMSLRDGRADSVIGMMLVTAGIVLLVVATFRLCCLNKEWIYTPTGSQVKEQTCFFDASDLPTLTDMLDDKAFGLASSVRTRPNGNIRMDYLASADGRFVAVQLFRFVPYTYEPVSAVYSYVGKDAEAFLHNQAAHRR